MRFFADIRGALAKSAALKLVPRAAKAQVTAWTTKTVAELMRAASRLQKSGAGRHTGDLARNIGYEIGATEERWQTIIGTGVGGRKSIVYAAIQDKGGTINARNRKYLTIPLAGVKGTAANYPGSFIVRSKKGNLLICERGRDGLRPLFALKPSVTLPATGWFSNAVYARQPLLDEMMRPEALFERAQAMARAGGKG